MSIGTILGISLITVTIIIGILILSSLSLTESANPLRLWFSPISDRDFKKILENIFNAPELEIDYNSLKTKLYKVRFSSGLKINDIEDFSWRQIKMFKDRLRRKRLRLRKPSTSVEYINKL